MNKNLLLGLCLIIAGPTFTSNAQIKGEGPKVKKTLTVEDFDGVSLKGSFDVVVAEGSKSVVAKGHGNIIERLETEVKGGVLNLQLKKGNYDDFQLTVVATTDMLEKLKVDGSGNMNVGSFSNLNDLALSASGSGDVNTTGVLKMSGDCDLSIAGSGNVELMVEAKDLEVSIGGSGNVKLSGSVEKQDVSIAGSGDFKAAELKSQEAVVSISGSGDANLDVAKKLEASIAGSGDVNYTGSPEVKSKVVGSGKVKQDE